MATAPTPTTGRERERHRNFEIIASPQAPAEWLAHADPYQAAQAFIRGDIDVRGDLVEAVREQARKASQGWRGQALNWLARWSPVRVAQMLQSRSDEARAIRFHYDRSNEFYRQFLDSRMVYSCAYFQADGLSLEEAQLAKLDYICRKLRVQDGERFLDVGCGWGALVMHAAEHYGAQATGCTLSRRQAEYAQAERERLGLDEAVTIHEEDYRDLREEFDKVASVGMVEHVGRYRLAAYFRKIHSLMKPHGLFLNHGITRPAPVPSDAQGLFVARQVFPGSRLVNLADVIGCAEEAGFEVLDVEDLRRHYALTCRAWVERLRARGADCLHAVNEKTWRLWQVYLAGSAAAFEDGTLCIYQVLLGKRGASYRMPMTREYMYPAGG